MDAVRLILISLALTSLASQVNGDWLSDLADTISAAAQSVANTLGSHETWDSVQAAFESAGVSDWYLEAWVSTEAGVQCLKDAGSDTETILACRRNLHQPLPSPLSGSAQSVANTLGSKATWDSVQAAFESAGVNTWTSEAWASSEAGIQCLKDAGSETEILACRRNLHQSFAGATSTSTSTSTESS